MAQYRAKLVLSPAEIDKQRALKLNVGDTVTIKGRTYEVIDSFRWGEDQVYILDGLGLVFYGELIREVPRLRGLQYFAELAKRGGEDR